jgi:hypothetical protein
MKKLSIQDNFMKKDIIIKQCEICGSDDFIIQETIFHVANLSPEDQELTVYKEQEGGIQKIYCKSCGWDYSKSNFKAINFR